MNQQQAESLASVFSGDAWESGGQWVAGFWRGDGKLVVFSEDAVSEYESDDAFDSGTAISTFSLASGDEEWWVILDSDGDVIYRDPDLKVGWRSQEEAEHEARGLESREDGSYFVKRMPDA